VSDSAQVPTTVGPFRIGVADYVGIYLHVSANLSERLMLILPLAIGPLVASFMLSVRNPPLLVGPGNSLWTYLTAAVIAVLTVLCFVILARSVIASRFRDRGFDRSSFSIALSRIGLSVDIELDGSTKCVEEPWLFVRRVIETKKRLYIFTSRIDAYVVPKIAFRDTQSQEAFVKVVLERSGVAVEKL
jgi:hypothetical protein